MLTHLRVKNFTIIDELDLDFDSGFTVLTGETGAGKSIIIDAISLLLGGQSSEDLIRTGESQAIIEGVFQIDPTRLKDPDFLDEETNTFIILRKITRNKPSEAKINGFTVTIKKLKEIMANIIAISGQNEHMLLINPDQQRNLIDQFSGIPLQTVLKTYQVHFAHYQELLNQQHQIEVNQADINRQIENLTFQLTDIDEHHFIRDEEDQLLQRQKEQKYFSMINTQLNQAKDQLDQSFSAQMVVASSLDKLTSLSNPAYQAILDRLKPLQIETEDIANQIQHELNNLTPSDEEELEAIDSRLDKIFRYKTKYNCQNLSELIDYTEQIRSKYEQLSAWITNSAGLAEQVNNATQATLEQAKQLHKIRSDAAKLLSAAVMTHMKDLHFLHSQFQINVILDEKHLTQFGGDKIEFLISLNPGEPLKPITAVASGGELSRILLAIKTVFSDIQEVDTVIFDEIDTGIGGVTAIKIGEKIEKISQKNQVFCITHLAQIAKFAHHHFVIQKVVEQDKTRVQIQKLDSDNKLAEIQRMIGGTELTSLFSRV